MNRVDGAHPEDGSAGADALRARLARAEADRDRARAEAEAARRLKDEFLAAFAHDLRNPLNAILGWVKLIGSGRLPPDAVREGLEVIERNAKLQAQLITDALDGSRASRGGPTADAGRDAND